MSNRTTCLPREAVRLNGILVNRYDSESPLVLKKPATIGITLSAGKTRKKTLRRVARVWASAGSITVQDTEGKREHVFDAYDDHPQGTDRTFQIDTLEKAVKEQLNIEK